MLNYNIDSFVSVVSSPLSMAPAPVSPRTALTSSWRQSQMCTIREENPVAVATENPPSHKPTKTNLPTLALPSFSHHLQQHVNNHSSNPLAASTGNMANPLSSSTGSMVNPNISSSFASHHASAPTSPITSPRGAIGAWGEEPLVAVRGAFNVATTTLKPRKALIVEIARTLEAVGISSSLSRSVFTCKVASIDHEEKVAERDNAQEDYKMLKEEELNQKDESGEDGKLRFEVEVCRVAGMEMLLGVRFQRVKGDKNEYQEICKKLIASMKL